MVLAAALRDPSPRPSVPSGSQPVTEHGGRGENECRTCISSYRTPSAPGPPSDLSEHSRNCVAVRGSSPAPSLSQVPGLHHRRGLSLPPLLPPLHPNRHLPQQTSCTSNPFLAPASRRPWADTPSHWPQSKTLNKRPAGQPVHYRPYGARPTVFTP